MEISTSRLTERSRTAVGHRALRIALALVVVGAGIASALLFASRSALFRLRDVQVSGATHLSDRGVLRLSGLSRHTNVLWFDAGAVEHRLESDPWVANATVARSLPGTVGIALTERLPVAVRPEGGSYVLIADDGAPLAMVRRRSGLPIIVAPPAPEAPARGLKDVARALTLLAPDLRARVRHVLVGVDGTLEMVAAGPLRIRYGTPDDLAAKAQALRDVLAWADTQGERVRMVDVSAASMPAAVLAG